jgi:hypothetical protein
LFGFIFFRWIGFYRPYFISDFYISITDRIKTYTSKNGEKIFLTVSGYFQPYISCMPAWTNAAMAKRHHQSYSYSNGCTQCYVRLRRRTLLKYIVYVCMVLDDPRMTW